MPGGFYIAPNCPADYDLFRTILTEGGWDQPERPPPVPRRDGKCPPLQARRPHVRRAAASLLRSVTGPGSLGEETRGNPGTFFFVLIDFLISEDAECSTIAPDRIIPGAA